MDEIYLYCLGVASLRYNIALHGYIAMSNHQHLLVRDNDGTLPAFLEYFHKLVAKAVNSLRGRWENMWAAEQPSAVHLVEKEDRFEKLIYLLMNPVAADLVERVVDWPGACSLGQTLRGETITVRRPKTFFGEFSKMPSEVIIRLEPVEGFEELTSSQWADKVSSAVKVREDQARAERHRQGKSIAGRKAVLRTSPMAQPKSHVARKGLRPQLACKNIARRIEELALLKQFRVAYRKALTKWREGKHRVLFPIGTYRMAWFGAQCESPPQSR